MTPGQQRRKDRQDEARRLQQADERIRELEGLIRHFMSLTHPEFGRAHDHPEFALHAIHARCGVEVGEYEDEVEAYTEMNVSDRSKPTRHNLEDEVERLRKRLLDVRKRLMHVDFKDLRRAQIDAKKIADNALDGGGGDND